MKSARIFNTTRQNIVCERCQIADSLLPRMRGLSWRKSLDDDEGLLIVPCPSIHMFGMKFSLDVVFVTEEMIVTDIRQNIAPRQIYVAKDNAGKPHSALEMPAGSVARCGVQIGDVLEVRRF
jgi:uncharacterized membrane protein (UPF0127 family)